MRPDLKTDILVNALGTTIKKAGSKNEFIASKFKERLSIVCQQNHISLNDFFTFYPQMSYDKYLDLIKKSTEVAFISPNASTLVFHLPRPISEIRSQQTFNESGSPS